MCNIPIMYIKRITYIQYMNHSRVVKRNNFLYTINKCKVYEFSRYYSISAHGVRGCLHGKTFCNRKWIFIGRNHAVPLSYMFFAVSGRHFTEILKTEFDSLQLCIIPSFSEISESHPMGCSF